MPYSKNQVIAARIAEHEPEKLNAANQGMLSMSHDELHKLASASTKGLPKKVGLKHVGSLARGKRKLPAKPMMMQGKLAMMDQD